MGSKILYLVISQNDKFYIVADSFENALKKWRDRAKRIEWDFEEPDSISELQCDSTRVIV